MKEIPVREWPRKTLEGCFQLVLDDLSDLDKAVLDLQVDNPTYTIPPHEKNILFNLLICLHLHELMTKRDQCSSDVAHNTDEVHNKILKVHGFKIKTDYRKKLEEEWRREIQEMLSSVGFEGEWKS